MICISNESRKKVEDFLLHFHDETDANGNPITDGDMLDKALDVMKELQKDFAKAEFPIATVQREDLETYGYDTSKISDDDIEMVASRMGKYYSEGYADTFKSDLESAAYYYELPEKED